MDYAIWTPANFVNFWIMPPAWQGLFVGIVSFFFNFGLAYISNREI